MNVKNYVEFLNSPAGLLAVRDAASLLNSAAPETDDKILLEQVMAIGFPKWAALRVFHQCTQRFAPLICRQCSREFRPRSLFTLDRPYCHPCAGGPKTPEQKIKHRARQLADVAEHLGKIKKTPCETCGATRNLHKHHPDYSRPLFVRWLCARCHSAEHKAMRKISREKIHASH